MKRSIRTMKLPIFILHAIKLATMRAVFYRYQYNIEKSAIHFH